MSQMLKSSGATAAATMASRVLGLVREMVYAAFMGKTWVADAFLLAFQIPNLFRRLLGEGALTAAFIPIFKEKGKREGDEAVWRATNAVISGLLVATVVIVVVAMIVISAVLGFGNIQNDGTLLMLRLLRVMFPYLLLVCLAAVFMGILNARGHFFVPAFGSAMLNIVLIASVFFLTPLFGIEKREQIFGLAAGVLIAGLAQAAFQFPLLRREGFCYRWVTPWKDETVRLVVRRMLPTVIGVAAFQINVLIASGFAFAFEEGIVSSFSYAVRLMELPQGVFGISLATYLLPTLAGLASDKKYPEFRTTLRDGVGYLVFVNLLATVLLIVLAEPIIRLLFERGDFRPEATPDVAIALMALAPGLIAFSLVNIFGRAFYALGDTATPMKISVFCLALNAAITIPLVWSFKQAGLGIANTTSAVCNIALLTFALRKKLARLEMAPLRMQIPALLGAGVVATGVALGTRVLWTEQLGHTSLALRLGEVFVPMIVATLAYFVIALLLKNSFAREVVDVLSSRFARARVRVE